MHKVNLNYFIFFIVDKKKKKKGKGVKRLGTTLVPNNTEKEIQVITSVKHLKCREGFV